MSDPQTSIGLYQVVRGGDVGVWDSPTNANWGTADSLAANISVIPLTNANVTLSTPPNAGSLWSGPYQSQSAILRFTGTLTGNCICTIPRSGFFIVENLCTVGAFYVALASSAPGNIICAPPGEAVHVYCDGVNVKYVDLDRIGAYMDLATSAVPAWITNCTVKPYLNCDGTSFSAVTYPQLSAYLGGTTLPDIRGRMRASLNQTTGRITSGSGGVDGSTLLAAGGSQVHTLTIPELPIVTPSGIIGGSVSGVMFFPGANNLQSGGGFNFNAGAINGSSFSFSGTPFGSGTAHTIMNPVTIAGLTLIRAG